MSDRKTHFGFETVDEAEKAQKVGGVFRSVASNYDLMNDLMSVGVHRLWKAFTVGHAGVREGYQILDVAGGSGDLSLAFAKRVGDSGLVVLSDINEAMLDQGRNRTIDEGLTKRVVHAQLDAEKIPFDDNQFNLVSIGFGLRNVTRIPVALKEMVRVIKPGGRLLVLEFSRPTTEIMRRVYDTYSFNVIPKIGKYVANDEPAYQYLVESIRKHPDQNTLKQMMLDAGFDEVKVHNMTGGVVALHVGYVY